MYLKLGLVVLDEFVNGKKIDGVKLIIHRAPAYAFTYTGVTVVAPDQISHRSVQQLNRCARTRPAHIQ